MIKYVGKRLFYAVLTILTLTVLTFFMMRLLPGDPFIGTKALPEATMAALNRKYGLDKPVLEQLIIYISNALKGDLGISIKYNRPVTDIISQAFPYSFDLGVRALIFASITGVLLGIVAAVKRGTGWDSASMFFAIIGVSVPNFIIGSLLQYLLGLKLFELTGIKFFPITGWDSFASKLIPAFALSFSSLATISRLMRTSMLDVLGQDYIKTAKSKGLSQSKIIWRHAVRNAIMPVITVLGPITASVLTGAFVVENIFSIPGMGKFFVMSIQEQDYTMISGITIFYGIFLVLANLLVDLAYGFIDPRVKIAEGKE
ncbi:MAG TPA: ABC transporter permease [Clostridiales bacterium]|nr:ABC transporter permease [Clostridiales bacterium]